jgi:hypothetical protein
VTRREIIVSVRISHPMERRERRAMAWRRSERAIESCNRSGGRGWRGSGCHRWRCPTVCPSRAQLMTATRPEDRDANEPRNSQRSDAFSIGVSIDSPGGGMHVRAEKSSDRLMAVSESRARREER